MATTLQPTSGETTKQLINYRADGGVAVIELATRRRIPIPMR